MEKKHILVLCTGNSCRSQMAEAYIRYFAGEKAEVYSAGIETHGVNPKAVASMQEDGIDLSGHTSNHVDEYHDIAFDFLITVCDHAQERCPVLPGNTFRLHCNFPDPAKATGSTEAIKQQFDHTRDLIKDYCRAFVHSYL